VLVSAMLNKGNLISSQTPVPVAARSPAVLVGSNPTDSMDVLSVVCVVSATS
jgi:hypothetical protein